MCFIQMGDQLFHTSLVWALWSLFPYHLVQGQLSVPDYHCKVHYFYLMEALICDCKENYDTDDTQDLCISNMNYSELLMDEVDRDRHSNDTDHKLGHKNVSFIDTITRHTNCILGVKSTFHLDSLSSLASCPLPDGEVERQLTHDCTGSSCCRRFCLSSTGTNTNPTNLVSTDLDDADMTDADSILDYCIDGLEQVLPPNEDSHMIQFADAVQEIFKDMNRFDKSKFPCAICDQIGHTFDTFPVLLTTDLKEAYLYLFLLV